MSEYEKNGGNYPDKGGTWSGPVSDDKDREAGRDGRSRAGGSCGRDPRRAGGTGTQDGPLQDMHPTSVDEKIEGIIAQSPVGLRRQRRHGSALLVRRRLEDAGISASDDDIQRVVDRVGNVGDGTRIEPGAHPER